jgi:hypothetical protein
VKKWPEIRAGLVATAIAFGLIEGCPLPPPDETPAWEKGLVEPIRDVQRVLTWPVAWIRPRLRVTQRWALYQAPGADRYRMSVEGQGADGQWQILYRAADPDHTEDADLIENAHVRGSWDPTNRTSSQYPRFAAWICARMLGRHPELLAARVRHEKVEIGVGTVTPTGEFTFTFVKVRQ